MGKKDKDSGVEPLGKQRYADLLTPMQVELNNLARWVKHFNKRVLILFEGRDTAGKGGAIHAVSETLNPRQVRVVALSKPTEQEQGQWYFQRHVAHLPAAGEIVLMDRSWYNRAGVEKVMGYCTDDEYKRFLRQAPMFEQMLVDDGILLFKYWLCVDQAEQEKRMAERLEHRSTCRHASSTRNTARHAMPCSRPRTRRMHRGRWWISMTSAWAA
jgi:polyphosphate kinase 2